MIGPGSVRECLLKQIQVRELITDHILTLVRAPGAVAINRWGHGRTQKAQKGLRRRINRL